MSAQHFKQISLAVDRGVLFFYRNSGIITVNINEESG